MSTQMPRLFLVISWLSLALACTRSAEADPGMRNETSAAVESCGSTDCSVPNWDHDVSLGLCPDGEIVVAHNAASSSSLIVCDCKCSSHDNTGWIVWTDEASTVQKVVQIRPGKLVSPDIFATTVSPVIRDRLADVRMCAPVDRMQMDQSDFTTLMKRPTNLEEFPYCFDPFYISIHGDAVRLKLGDHWIDTDDAEIFGEKVSNDDLEELNELLSG